MKARHGELVTVVARRADLAPHQAELTVRATVAALAENVDTNQTHQLMSVLPETLNDTDLPGQPVAEPVEVSDFLQSVADRDRLDPDAASRRVWAVVAALDAQPETHDPVQVLLATGGQPYQQLLPPPPQLSTEAGMTDTLRQRLDLDDADQARQALGATLAALGRELSDGQARKLGQWLPAVLAGDLLSQRPRAEDMSGLDFLRDVADRRGLNTDTVWHEARTVLGVIREAVPEPHIATMASQLSGSAADLLR